MPRFLDVQNRGHFFDDPFFRDSWAEFDVMVQRSMNRMDRGSPMAERLKDTLARRKQQITHEKMNKPTPKQPMPVTEKGGYYQAVMDVREFNPRDLQVRAMDDRRIVVEGKLHQGSSEAGSETFVQEFLLPAGADIDKVSTALSKDGVLTIRAPAHKQTSDVKYPRSDESESGSELDYSDSASVKSNGSNSSSNYSAHGNRSRNPHLESSSSNLSCNRDMTGLTKGFKDQLYVNDSGLSSGSSNYSSCSSPAPSDYSDTSSSHRSHNLSKTEEASAFHQPRTPVRSTNQAENSTVINRNPYSEHKISYYDEPRSQSQVSAHSIGRSNMPVAENKLPSQPTFTVGCGSSGDTSVTLEEKDGERMLKAEKRDVIHGFDSKLESRHIETEIEKKDGQLARKEEQVRINRIHEDPNGRFRGAEKAESSDMKEMCVQEMPDGSKMTIKKNCSSTTSHKVFTSNEKSSPFDDPFFKREFSSDFGDLRQLMGTGHSLMSQMSNDSENSFRSTRSPLGSERSSSSMSNNSNAQDNYSNISSLNRKKTSLSSENSNSAFPRSSSFAQRPSMASRFPNFSDPFQQMDSFGGFSSFDKFPKLSETSKHSFDSFFDRKF